MLAATFALLGACASLDERPEATQQAVAQSAPSDKARAPAESGEKPSDRQEEVQAQESSTQEAMREAVEPYVRYGDSQFELSEGKPPEGTVTDGEPVSLNFRDIRIDKAVQHILGTLLARNYTIVTDLQGEVTLSTAQPVPRKRLWALLDMIVAQGNAVVVRDNGLYKVMSRSQALERGVIPRAGRITPGEGFSARVFSPDHITPSALRTLLEPFVPPDAFLLVDDKRNLLVLAGSASDLREYQRIAATFDVDWLDGRSVAVIPLRHAEPDTMRAELAGVLGGEQAPSSNGAPGQPFRLMAMDRLGAIVVFAAHRSALDRARDWIRRLDRPGLVDAGAEIGQSDAPRFLYVHPARNSRATELAETLTKVFSGANVRRSDRGRDRDGGRVAPALGTTTRSSASNPDGGLDQGASGGIAVSGLGDSGIAITAVEEQNTLLIRATAAQYRAITSAIEKLDREPMQVLIEARIIEVSLSDGLEYGVRWFLEETNNNAVSEANFGGTGLLDEDAASFSFTYTAADAAAVLRALEDETRVEVLSAPSLMAMNNRSASINVGDQIPVVTTRITTGPAGDADTQTSEVEYLDTGVQLTVTPRVNPGGMVFMEVAQNVSDPGETEPGTGNRVILQREIESTVAVQDSETVILGGLIRENTTQSKAGIPLLKDVPLLGALFRNTRSEARKTELMVMLTPRVIRTRQEARGVAREYGQRFEMVDPLEGPAADTEQPTSTEPIDPT